MDLARVSAKIGVPHGILCNIAFEHGLEMSVDEVRAAGPPQKSVKEVFVKNLEGKLLFFSFTEEDTVLDLRNRVAMACKVSVDQFVLVFQSRTLQSSVKVESTGVQRGHTFYMQGALKGWMQRQGLMGGECCTQFGATRVWPARTSCFRCGFKRDGSGYTASVLKSIRESQDHFVPQSGKWVGKDSTESKLGVSYCSCFSASTWAG